VTRGSVLEYAAAVRDRYLRASRTEKKVILDEFCKVTGQHRKSAIGLLHRVRDVTSKRPGRPRAYGSEFILALKVAWDATDHVCSKRLAPFDKEGNPDKSSQGAASEGTLESLRPKGVAPVYRRGDLRGRTAKVAMSSGKPVIGVPHATWESVGTPETRASCSSQI
jgi:hypothetical protein